MRLPGTRRWLRCRPRSKATVKRVHENPALHAKFPLLPEVDAWKQLFQVGAKRYPLLIIIGASYSGKTEFANSLFENPLELQVGGLAGMPDKLRLFQRHTHDGIVFR